jgi:hypothetical protein
MSRVLRAALRQVCPLCGEGKGVWCKNRGSGFRAPIHQARIRLAQQRDRQLLKDRQMELFDGSE